MQTCRGKQGAAGHRPCPALFSSAQISVLLPARENTGVPRLEQFKSLNEVVSHQKVGTVSGVVRNKVHLEINIELFTMVTLALLHWCVPI